MSQGAISKLNVKSQHIMQHPPHAGSDRSAGTEPAALLLGRASVPTGTCNSDLIVYVFLLNKKPI